MTTNTPGSQARQDPRQVSNTMRKLFNFNDVASGVQELIGTLPANAWVITVHLRVITAFNAGTTNTIVIGTAGTPNSLMQTGDNTPGTPGMYASPIARLGPAGVGVTDQQIFVTYTQTGTAATTGQAEAFIEFEGGFPGIGSPSFGG